MRSPWLCLLIGATLSAQELPEGEPLSATVSLVNRHARAVRIERMDSSCVCSRLEVGTRFLLPGASATVAVMVDTRNRSGPQRLLITAFLTDPELEPLEEELRWVITPAVLVDALPPGAPSDRRPEPAWQDIYRFTAHERPDEPNRLRKRIRLVGSNPGFRVEGVDYSGNLWRFITAAQADGSWLVTGLAASDGVLPIGRVEETVIIRTNHPTKPSITLLFSTRIDQDAGRQVADPLLPPPPL